MKGVILAAGLGSRLGKITKSIPKPLIKVKGVPVIERNIKVLSTLGVEEIFINMHYKSELIREFIGEGDKHGIKINYSIEHELLGTAGALNNFKEKLVDDFFVVYGDNYFDFNLDELRKVHFAKKAGCTIGLYTREDSSESGVVFLDDKNRITGFIEKPGNSLKSASLVNTGIYICSPSIFDFIPKGFSDFGKDIFPKMIQTNFPLFGVQLKGFLFPIDNPILLNIARDKNDSG